MVVTFTSVSVGSRDDRNRCLREIGQYVIEMMADVIGMPVIASAVPEASSRGAALVALKSLGTIHDFSDAPATFGQVFEPEAVPHEKYRRGRARQEKLYDLLIDV